MFLNLEKNSFNKFLRSKMNKAKKTVHKPIEILF